MSVDLSDPAISRACNDLGTGKIDWLLLRYISRDALTISSVGSNGLEGLKIALSRSSQDPQFGLLHAQGKTLLLSFLPVTLAGVRRARCLVHARSITQSLRHDSTIAINRSEDLTAAVREKLNMNGSGPSSPNPATMFANPSGSTNELPPSPGPSNFTNSPHTAAGHARNDSRELSPSAMQFLTISQSMSEQSITIPDRLDIPAQPSEDLSTSFDKHTNMPSPIALPPVPTSAVLDYLASRPHLPDTQSAVAVKGVPTDLAATNDQLPNRLSKSRTETTTADEVKHAYQSQSNGAVNGRYSPTPIDNSLEQRKDSNTPELQSRVPTTGQNGYATNHSPRILDEEESDRREAALRQQKEEDYRIEQERSEAIRVEQQERQRIAEVERVERERQAAEARRRAEEEEKKRVIEEARVRAEAKAQAAAAMKAQFQQLKSDGRVMLSGNVSVQGCGSMIWRRRYFELGPSALKLYKSQHDRNKVLASVDLAPSRHPSIQDSFEETLIQNSFKLVMDDSDGDPYLFFCDEESDKDLFLAALAIASS